MNARMQARVLVPILVLVAASLSACTSSGSVASPQATPSATATAPATAPPSAAPSPTAPPASPDPLPEGEYVSPPLTAEMMVAAVEAHGLDPADLRPFFAEEGFTDNEVVTIRLADGQLTLFQSNDRGTPILGWKGAYEFVDDHTFVADDSYPITYGFRWEGDKLHMSVLKDLFPDPVDLVIQVALYESAPFTLVP
jgi:hypothetical protein